MEMNENQVEAIVRQVLNNLSGNIRFRKRILRCGRLDSEDGPCGNADFPGTF